MSMEYAQGSRKQRREAGKLVERLVWQYELKEAVA